MEISLSHARLRPLRKGDENSLARYANNRNVWRNLRDTFPHPYTLDDARDWLQRVSGRETHYAIEVGGEAVGGISLRLQPDVARHSAEIGYWLGEAHWGRGIMTEAVREVTAYGFTRFDLIRIYACVFEWNTASARVLKKAGYQFEGRRRKAVTKDGQVIDDLMYAILRDDWLKVADA